MAGGVSSYSMPQVWCIAPKGLLCSPFFPENRSVKTFSKQRYSVKPVDFKVLRVVAVLPLLAPFTNFSSW